MHLTHVCNRKSTEKSSTASIFTRGPAFFPRKKKRAINFNAAVEIADAGNLYAPLTYGKTHATLESNFMREGGEKDEYYSVRSVCNSMDLRTTNDFKDYHHTHS